MQQHADKHDAPFGLGSSNAQRAARFIEDALHRGRPAMIPGTTDVRSTGAGAKLESPHPEGPRLFPTDASERTQVTQASSTETPPVTTSGPVSRFIVRRIEAVIRLLRTAPVMG